MKFSEAGNALVRFSNKERETYYIVIDKNGEMLFEPVKRNNEALIKIIKLLLQVTMKMKLI